MANFFAQFHDTPEPAAPSGTANFFARFHPEPAGTEPTFDDRFNAVSDEAAFRAVKPQEKKFGLADTWPAKIAQSIYSAVTLPGDVVAGKAHVPGSEDAQAIPSAVPFGSPESSGERIGDLAMVGTPLSAANGSGKLIAEGAGLGRPATSRAPTIPELKAGATANYEGPELTSLEVKPVAITDFAARTKVGLNGGGIDENLAPKTFAILDKLEKVPDGATVTGNNIKSLRQLLGNAASEPGQEGLAAKRALNALDEHIPNIETKNVIAGDPKAAGDALATANADYSAAMHAQTIDNKTVRAELRAAASNSGHNVANTIRQRMADILNPERPDLQRGFQPDELAMMDRIVRGTRTQNAMRWAGNYLGGGGGLGALHTSAAGAGIGAAIAGPLGAVVGAATPPALGYLLKSFGNKGTLADAAALSEMIRSRAPLASSAQKFEEAATGFSHARNPRTVAAVSIAARNLATNLKDAGLNISTTDLMKSLQMSGTGRADQQQ